MSRRIHKITNREKQNGFFHEAEYLWPITGPGSFRFRGNQSYAVIEDEDSLDLVIARSLIEHEIDKFPKRQKEILKMYIHGTKMTEIAKIFHISQPRVSIILKQVGDKLRKFIPTFQKEA